MSLKPFKSIQPLIGGLGVTIRLLWQMAPSTLVGMTLAVVTSAAMSGSAIVIAGNLIGRLPAVRQDAYLDGQTVSLLVGLTSLLLLKHYIDIGMDVGAAALKRRTDAFLRERVLRLSSRHVGIAHLEQANVRTLIDRARNISPLSFTPGDAAHALPTSVGSRLEAISCGVIILWHKPILGFLAISAWTFSQRLAASSTIKLVTKSAWSLQSPDINYTRELALANPAAKEVRVFGLAQWLGSRFASRANAHADIAMEQRRGILKDFLQAGIALGAGFALCLTWLAVEASTTSVATSAVLVLAVVRIFTPIGTYADIPLVYGVSAVPAIEEMEQLLRDASEPGWRPAPFIDNKLEVQDVCFHYAGSGENKKQVLDQLNLDIRAGERLALVGLNGSGKTTLVKLLCRFYEPTSGAIRADGLDMREIDAAMWRRRLAVVFQDFIHYELTLRDNIALTDQPCDRGDDVMDAAEVAGLSPLIERLPAGLDTYLSPSRTGGVELSGGEWQRVALARAAYAVGRGARLLILDEPTAGLDARSELSFFEEVLGHPKLRATPDGSLVGILLISHRFATVRYADRIAVLSDGRISETGTHEELLSLGGQYSDMFRTQASLFRNGGM